MDARPRFQSDLRLHLPHGFALLAARSNDQRRPPSENSACRHAASAARFGPLPGWRRFSSPPPPPSPAVTAIFPAAGSPSRRRLHVDVTRPWLLRLFRQCRRERPCASSHAPRAFVSSFWRRVSRPPSSQLIRLFPSNKAGSVSFFLGGLGAFCTFSATFCSPLVHLSIFALYVCFFHRASSAFFFFLPTSSSPSTSRSPAAPVAAAALRERV